jgi:hypothetical protein
MSRKVTAALLITAAVLTNAAFTVLGMVFNYPDVLKEPVEEILAKFRASQNAVMFWFALLALSAALFGPIAVGVGRLSTHRAMRVAVPVGIAAAVVQVIGLLRWPLLVPGFAADASSPDPRPRPRRATPSFWPTRSWATSSARPLVISSPQRGRCWYSWHWAEASPGCGSPPSARCLRCSSWSVCSRRLTYR